ncbi:MAG: hypothetical protein KCHDKBKB_01560 [Elusimicrobia bacterium]|nr:hypothetical protein [Elusimicrobiota bacterium]
MLSAWVLLNTHQRKANRIFATLCTVIGMAAFSFVFLDLSGAGAADQFWWHTHLACLLLIPPLLFHQILRTLNHPGRNERGAMISKPSEHLMQLAYVFSGGFYLFSFQENLFAPLTVHGLTVPRFVSGFSGLITVFAIPIIWGLILVVKTGLNATEKAHRNRLLLIGFSSACVGITFASYMVTPFQSLPKECLPALYSASTVALMVMAIPVTSTRLYQITECVRQTISHLFTAMIMCFTFLTMQMIVNQIMKGENISIGEIVALCIGSIVTAFVVLPRRFYIQKVTDRIFFRDRSAQAEKIEDLLQKISLAQDKEGLLKTLFEGLQNGEAGFSTGCLMMKASKKPFYRIVREWGLPADAKGFFLKEEHLLIQFLKMEKREIFIDRLKNRILADWDRQELRDEMEILQADICFPIFKSHDHSLIGLIALGNSKLGYSSYVGRNLFWLKTLIDRANTMLDNFFTHEQNNALIPYAGRAVAEEVLRNKESFRDDEEGERAWVTVMMIDIRHFTSLSTRLDPRSVVKLLKEFREVVSQSVIQHGGAIDKFIGDAVMANFGLPILPDRSDPDKKAVLCAAAIMDAITRTNKRNGWAHAEKISIGIGISSGEVIAGNVESGERTEYTVVGDAPNMVARLEDMAQESQVLISPATYKNVKDDVVVLALPPQHLEGFSEPVVIYELKGTKDLGSNGSSGGDSLNLASNQ